MDEIETIDTEDEVDDNVAVTIYSLPKAATRPTKKLKTTARAIEAPLSSIQWVHPKYKSDWGISE